MLVEVIPLTDFMHGAVIASEGHPVTFPEGVADDLERAGLVRVRGAVLSEKVSPGKAQDDGKGQPSSASPAAPASPTKTLHSSKAGETKTRKRGE